MPNTADAEYGKDQFFISPLIKGQKPWLVNIVTMNGAYSEIVIDGVMYRMIACDQVEMFADRGVYLAISSGTTFYSNKAFMYNEIMGEIRAKEDYSGASVLFDLPLDVEKADPAKAEAYLNALLNPSPSQDTRSNERSTDAEEDEWISRMKDLRAKIRNGETIGKTIADSVKEVSYDDSGNITYNHGDWSLMASPEDFFREGQIGLSDRFSVSGSADGIYKALLFHRDANGVITGRIVILD